MADRIQVAMEPTSQEILKDTTAIKADTANMKPNVANTNLTVNSMNQGVGRIETNLGSNGESASSSPSASVNRKINWLLNNSSTKSVLKVSGLDANYASQSLTNQLGTIVPYSGDANLYLNVYGSGRLLYLINGTNHYALYVKIDGKSFSLGYEGIFDIPFSSSLRIEHGGSPDNAPRLIYYELNQ